MSSKIASPNPTRRVLGDISINTPISGTNNVLSPKAMGIAFGNEKENSLSTMSLFQGKDVVSGGKISDRPVLEEAKGVEPPLKRQRIGSEQLMLSPKHNQQLPQNYSSPLSRASSPASTQGSQTATFIDSQNTTITDSELSHLGLSPPASRVLTKTEIREKAIELKLRLRLANYKVRTNQTNLPFSQLEIRSLPGHTKANPTSISTLRPLVSLRESGCRIPSPSQAFSFASSFASVPQVRIQLPSSREGKQNDRPISVDDNRQSVRTLEHNSSRGFSPGKIGFNRDAATQDMDRVPTSLATPLLEGQRDDDLNASISPSREIKGAAADGLLKLMHRA